MRCRLAFLFVLMLSSQAVLAEPAGAEPWEQIDDDDGIKVWKHEVPGLDLPGFRGETTIDAAAEKIAATISDAPHHTEWMFRCAESKIVEQRSPDDALLYNRTASPWPVWDRDVVLETRTSRASDGLTIVLSFHDSRDGKQPLADKVVRMPRLVGFYKLVKLSEAQTRVTYQVEADPGGSLPRWLAARIARDLPFETLSRLRKRVSGKT